MKLWKIEEPKYNSIKERKKRNGSLSMPFGMPGVSCCDTWSSYGAIDKCFPSDLKHIKDFKDGWAVPIDRFLELKRLLRQFPEFENLDDSSFEPGISFQPSFFNPPTQVDGDFLWTRAGLPIISHRVANILTELSPNDILITPTNPETEWCILFVKSKSNPPHDRVSDAFCNLCGRGNRISSPSDLNFYRDMLPKSNIFVFATTLYIMVTEVLMEAFKSANIKNVSFNEVDVLE